MSLAELPLPERPALVVGLPGEHRGLSRSIAYFGCGFTRSGHGLNIMLLLKPATAVHWRRQGLLALLAPRSMPGSDGSGPIGRSLSFAAVVVRDGVSGRSTR